MPALDFKTQALTCRNHDARAGYGICRRCRGVLCDECATFLDGVLTCPACIEALAEREQSAFVAVGDGGKACLVALAFGLAGSTLVLYGMTWLLRS